MDGGKGQEGGAAGVPLLQKADGGFGVLFGAHHNILHGGPHSGFDGNGVLLGHPEQPGKGPVDAGEIPPAGLLHHRLDALGKPFQVPLQIFQHLGPAQLLLDVQMQAVILALLLLGLLLAGLDPELIAPHGILQGFQPGVHFRKHGGVVPDFLLQALLLASAGKQHLLHGILPGGNLPDGGLGAGGLHSCLG